MTVSIDRVKLMMEVRHGQDTLHQPHGLLMRLGTLMKCWIGPPWLPTI